MKGKRHKTEEIIRLFLLVYEGKAVESRLQRDKYIRSDKGSVFIAKDIRDVIHKAGHRKHLQ